MDLVSIKWPATALLVVCPCLKIKKKLLWHKLLLELQVRNFNQASIIIFIFLPFYVNLLLFSESKFSIFNGVKSVHYLNYFCFIRQESCQITYLANFLFFKSGLLYLGLSFSLIFKDYCCFLEYSKIIYTSSKTNNKTINMTKIEFLA